MRSLYAQLPVQSLVNTSASKIGPWSSKPDWVAVTQEDPGSTGDTASLMRLYQDGIVQSLDGLRLAGAFVSPSTASTPQGLVLSALSSPQFSPQLGALEDRIGSAETLDYLIRRANYESHQLPLSSLVNGGKVNLALMPFLLPDDSLFAGATMAAIGSKALVAVPKIPHVEDACDIAPTVLCRTLTEEQTAALELAASLTELLVAVAGRDVPGGACINNARASAADDENGYAGREVVGQATVDCGKLFIHLYSNVVVGDLAPDGGVSGPANVNDCDNCDFSETSVSDGEVYPGNSYTIEASDYRSPDAAKRTSDPSWVAQYVLF